jgi:hypothetical protein
MFMSEGLGKNNFASGRETKVLPGVNSFEHNHPDLMEEWDRVNNYLLCDPDAILDNYSKNVC